MEPFETQGYWWLPGRQEKCPGTLQCNEAGELRLHLFGALTNSETFFSASSQIPVVYGEVVELAGVKRTAPAGRCVTLLHSFVSGEMLSGQRTQSLFSHRGIFGDEFIPSSGAGYRVANLSFSGLPSWARNVTGITKEITPGTTLSAPWARPAESPSVPFWSGQLRLVVTANIRATSRERTLKERVILSLAYPSEVAEPALEKDVYALQNFLTFATDHPNALSLFEVRQRPAAEDRAMRVIGPSIFDDEKAAEDLRPHDMLFEYQDVAPRFATVLQRWGQLSEQHAAAFAVYFGSRYAAPRHSDVRFQLISQVLSLYDAGNRLARPIPSVALLQSRADSLTEHDRELIVQTHPLVAFTYAVRSLANRLAPAFEPLVGGNEGAGLQPFLDLASKTLHHVLFRAGALAEDSTAMSLYWMTEILGFLWKIALLDELGFGPEEQKVLLSRNRLYSHISHSIAPALFA